MLPLALALLACGAAPVRAAQLRVKSFAITLPTKEDLPVVRGLMQTRPGSPYSPGATAGDLRRLQMLGVAVTKLALAFGDGRVDISLAAADAEKPVRPGLASLELTGGAAGINRACRAALRQRPSTLFRKRMLDVYALLIDVRTVERMYGARGYLDARVSRVEVSVDGQAARASIHVLSGPRFVLGNVTVHGNREIKAAELIEALKLANAAPWTEMLRLEIVDRAALFCRERGYLDAKVEAESRKRADGIVDVQLNVTEGDRHILNNVVVRGARQHKGRVAKLVGLRRDQVVKRSEVEALRRAIEDLGLFTGIEMVFVPLRDGPAGRRDLVIRLKTAGLSREAGTAEKLYYEMVQNVIRVYNRGGRELGAVEVSGFFTAAGGRVDFDARIVRPDFARLTLRPKGKAASPSLTFLSSGGTTVVGCSTMKASVRIPAALAAKIALLPAGGGLPTRLQLAPGLTSGKAGADVLALGGRCPPVAAYFTERAALFDRTPPTIGADGRLILADADGGRLTITLNEKKLPVRVVRQDKSGATTATFDIKLNAAAEKGKLAQPPDPKGDAAGFGLVAPALLGLGMPETAADLADRGVELHPKTAACRAARGLVRLATGPPEPGLADLRQAAARSGHPAYALLLAEALIRGERFAEAKAVCAKAMKAAPPKAGGLEPADIILGMSLSLHAGFEVMTSGRGDYAKRAAVDNALAHIGLNEHKQAAELARKLLAADAMDRQAAELLARAELSLGSPKTTLDALAKLDLPQRPSQLDVYAALAHHALGDDVSAAAALTRAIKKAPRLRNLLLLQRQAAEIHERHNGAAAKAALAKIFSRAVMGTPKPEEKARLAAIVNDAYVVKADLDALAAQLGKREDLRDVPAAKLRDAALNQIIEDMLAIRWAMWRGITVRDADVRRAIDGEIQRLGVPNLEAYKRLLKERGKDVADRAAEIRDSLLKRGAVSAALADKILVRPEHVRSAYEKDIARFKVLPTARIRMIALEFARFPRKEDAHRLALALLRRLKARPDSFADLAREYSHDANAERGGLWEDVAKASLIDPLDKAVFGLKPGETTGIVKTALGCHIVRLEKLTPERTIPLEEAAAKIARSLQESRARAEIAAWLKRLRAESHVEIIETRPAPTSPP